VHKSLYAYLAEKEMIRTKFVQKTETHFMFKSFRCCKSSDVRNKRKRETAPELLHSAYISELVAVSFCWCSITIRRPRHVYDRHTECFIIFPAPVLC
jgi:hypothetical protein